MFPAHFREKAVQVLDACRKSNLMLATAESCTGGMIAGCLTAIPGSSDVVERGFVTYTNAAKQEMLGVPEGLFVRGIGAVSHQVAEAMADGTLANAPVQLALSVTGVAGPGAQGDKPAGLVYIGCALAGQPTLVEKHEFPGDRDTVRAATIAAALDLALRRLTDN